MSVRYWLSSLTVLRRLAVSNRTRSLRTRTSLGVLVLQPLSFVGDDDSTAQRLEELAISNSELVWSCALTREG